jgi:hypothetical protein
VSTRAVFLEVDRECLELHRQWKVCLEYCRRGGLTLAAYATDPAAAAGMVDNGQAAVVVAAVPGWRGADPECLKGKIRYARGETAEQARDRQVTAALDLLERAQRTGDMGAVAEALAVLRYGAVPPPRPPRGNARTRPLNPADVDPTKPVPWEAA